MKKFPLLLILILLVGLVLAVVGAWQLISRPALPAPTMLPSPQAYRVSQTPAPSFMLASPVVVSPVAALPPAINLAVPFTPQAPTANWDLPYQEFCEEASVLMAASYIKDEKIAGPDDATTKLLAIKDFEEKKFGYYQDTTGEETAIILREYYKIGKVRVSYDPTAAEIKQALAESELVLVPAAGRQLPNPYFQHPGPLYHMLVIKGYTADGKFITNDPGTRHGADFLYQADALLHAVHDWNGGNVEAGRPVMIIVG